MYQDLDLTLEDWTKIANSAGLGGPNAWNLYQDYITSRTRMDALEAGTLVGAPYINVQGAPYLAKGDGFEDDSTSIRNALAALAALGGGTLFFPAGTYKVSKQGSFAYALDIPGNNINMEGIPGRSIIKMQTGLPANDVVVIRINQKDRFKFIGLDLDGSWGAVDGVTTTKDGINHATMADPSSHGFQCRGSTNILIQDCNIYQCYGDAMWFGAGATSFTVYTDGVRIFNTRMELCARSGIAFGSRVENLVMRDCFINNVFATPIDTEPGGGSRTQPCRNIVIDSCDLAGWWWTDDPARSGNVAMSIVGPTLWAHRNSNVRQYRVTNCDIRGGVIIASAEDVVLDGNRFTSDFGGFSYAPVIAWGYLDGLQIINNWFYDRSHPDTGSRHDAVISVQMLAGGTANHGPRNVTVAGNYIQARNGRHGIKIEGTGGGAYASTGNLYQAGETGTATTVVETWPHDSTGIAGQNILATGGTAVAPYTVVKTGAGWLNNQWVNWYLRSKDGGQWGFITANTSDTITVSGWTDEDGVAAAVPDFTPNKTFFLYPTLIDSAKAWTPNQWPGREVRIGTKSAPVYANFATALVLDRNAGWCESINGTSGPAPAAGAYRIMPASGVVDVFNNTIDCTDEGNGAGAFGIYLYASRGGMRVRCNNNKVRNATTDGINVKSEASRPFLHLELQNNFVWDDQPVPTCTSAVRFQASTTYGKLILANNTPGTGVTNAVSGLTTGWWLVRDGHATEWEGYGTPEGVVTANVGSRAYRLDGGAATTLYVKTSGTGNVGWTAK